MYSSANTQEKPFNEESLIVFKYSNSQNANGKKISYVKQTNDECDKTIEKQYCNQFFFSL